MAQVVRIDDVVPEDIEFAYRGAMYRLPGDIDVQTTLRLAWLLGQLSLAEEQQVAAADAERGAVEQLLLELFRVNHPQLERLPFGVTGFRVVLTHLLAALGFGEDQAEDAGLDEDEHHEEKEVSAFVLVARVTEEFGWPPEAWRTMPWVTFKAWCGRANERAIDRVNARLTRDRQQREG